ncbi:hypothetical protein TNCV_4554421 [Trichonephila clavipes]|nr:hypothetical protein TNCV_4554421 [Trichonephila clavipes]
MKGLKSKIPKLASCDGLYAFPGDIGHCSRLIWARNSQLTQLSCEMNAPWPKNRWPETCLLTMKISFLISTHNCT